MERERERERVRVSGERERVRLRSSIQSKIRQHLQHRWPEQKFLNDTRNRCFKYYSGVEA